MIVIKFKNLIPSHIKMVTNPKGLELRDIILPEPSKLLRPFFNYKEIKIEKNSTSQRHSQLY